MTAVDGGDPLAPPYGGHLERVAQRMAERIAAAPPVESEHPGAGAAVHAALDKDIAGLADDLVGLSHDIAAHPELGFEEHHAAAAVAATLAAAGIDAEVGAYGLETAVRARVGSGRPRVALIAEYDALPGIGHACGHNLICATSVGAFLALSRVVEDLGGSAELIGTPAEEGGGGKEIIARAGGFDEVDAALMLHPFPLEGAEQPWIGVRQVEVVYTGLPAHASAAPFQGRNALDGVVAAYTGIAALRQHILPDERIHGVITDGGRKPNIVPARAAAQFYVRSGEPENLRVLSERVQAVLDGAAAMTGTRVEVRWDPIPVYLPVRSNTPLATRYALHAAARGRSIAPPGLMPPLVAGSTDMGNVSVRVPSIHATLAVGPPDVSIHTPEFAAVAVAPAADAALLDGAAGLARTAADFLADAGLRADVTAAFEAAGGAIDPDELLG